MDVFGNTFDSERKQMITNLEDTIKILSIELNDKIVLLENKIKTRTNEINKIISKILDRLNTIEVYFSDRVSRKETVEEKARA